MRVARGSPVKSIALAVAWMAVMSVASPVHAQEDEAFKEGLNARRESNWAEAERQMRRATRADPKESTRRVGGRLGFGGTDYLPYFFLGEALFNRGNCAGAVVAWATSERQGVIQTRQEHYQTLQKGNASCEAKGVLLPAKYAPQMARSRERAHAVNALATTVSELGKAHPDVWRARSTILDQYNRATAEIETANALLETVESTRLESDFAAADAATDRARALLTTLEGELRTEIARGAAIRGLIADVRRTLDAAQKLNSEVEEKRSVLTSELNDSRARAVEILNRARAQLTPNATEASLTEAGSSAREATALLEKVLEEVSDLERRTFEVRLDRATARARETLATVESQFSTIETLMQSRPGSVQRELPGRRDDAWKRFEGVRRRLEAARRTENLPGIERASVQGDQLRTELEEILSGFGPVTLEDRGVPTWLQTGASLFLQGEYDQSLAALDSTKEVLADSPRLHVHLFRAAAFHALYIRSGETSETHRTQALAEIQHCKAIDSTFEPDERAFAPRFIAFFRSGPSAAAHATNTP